LISLPVKRMAGPRVIGPACWAPAWCLECSPTPGYSFYDRVCDGAASDALIKHLST